MSISTINKVRIAGISACVPKNVISNYDYKWVSDKERENLIKTIGIKYKRAVNKGVTTSDLAFEAATKLIADLNWDKKEIELLVLVTQSADYQLPASAIILQNRLGLSNNCMAFDINLGCSGYVYGLSFLSAFIQSTSIKKALLLTGEVSSASASYRDKSIYPLFGDAATATALELSDNASPFHFNLQSDGAGYKTLIIPHGGLRNLVTKESLKSKKISTGIYRNKIQVVLRGADILNFALEEVSPNIKKLLHYCNLKPDNIDFFVFHQANKLINENIRKMMRIDPSKFPSSLENFGNTSSASIPLTLVTQIREVLITKELNLILAGFGVGLSWGSIMIKTDKIVCPELIEV